MIAVPAKVEWSLDELVSEAGRLLGTLDLDALALDGRVSAAPDARTVRYYTTLGLLDRPRIEGREARYGRRHLLQLAAVKALQAEGLSLGDVQERLYARTDRELTALLEATARRRKPEKPRAAAPVTWREIVLEPGLRVLAAADWTPTSRDTLTKRFEAAVTALSSRDKGAAKD